MPDVNGKQPWELTPEDKALRAEDIIRRRREGATFHEIAESWHLTRKSVSNIYYETLKRVPMADVAEHRREQLERYDIIRSKLMKVVDRSHPVLFNGEVVRDADGKPIENVAPVLAALNSLMRLEAQQATLLGLNAPAKHELTVETVNYNIVGIDPAAITGRSFNPAAIGPGQNAVDGEVVRDGGDVETDE